MIDQFYEEINKFLITRFPVLEGEKSFHLRHLASPEVIEICSSVRAQVESAIQAFFKLSRSSEYQTLVAREDGELPNYPSKNFSVLMAYDFHVDLSEEKAYLIEINTNASGFIFAAILEEFRNKNAEALSSLRDSFLSEMELFGRPVKTVAIIDESISEQRMYPEFLCYQQLFREWGFECEIVDYSLLNVDNEVKSPSGATIDFIYNRYCDFTLSEGRSQHLLKAYKNQLCAFSPQPREYVLLADKKRLANFTSELFWKELSPAGQALRKDIENVLIPSYNTSDFESHEDIWKQRKNLFFKPKNLFGGKATYRGSSISRKMFDQMIQNDPLIQKFVPAPEWKDWKFDLRVFVYQDQIQLSTARLYKGQVTNFSQPHGGFTPVRWK